jgi:phosphatidate phosphatase PAH1
LPNRLFHAEITFFHAGITFFHAAASSVKKSDSSVKKSDSSVKKSDSSLKKSSSSVKKSTFFHARVKSHEKPDLRWMGTHLNYLELSAGKDKQVIAF